MENNGFLYDSELKDMAKHGKKNRKAYKEFKRLPGYYFSRNPACYYKKEVSCTPACLLHKYCTKKGKNK